MTSHSEYITRRSLLSSLALTTGALALSSSRALADDAPIRVGASTNEGYGALFYAADLGLFAKAKLPVEIVMLQSGAAIAAALAGGSLEIGGSSIFVFMNARRHGLPYTIVAPGAVYATSAPSAALVVANGSPIQTARDLSGKIVGGLTVKSLDQLAVDAWVDKNGGDSNTLQVIEVPGPSMLEQLEQGRISAALMQEPQLSLARQRTRILGKAYDAIASRFLISSWFSSTDWAAKNLAAAKTFNAAIQQAAAWANLNPEKAAASIEKWAKISIPRIHTVNGDKLDASLIQPVCDTALKYKLIDAPMDAREFIWSPRA